MLFSGTRARGTLTSKRRRITRFPPRRLGIMDLAKKREASADKAGGEAKGGDDDGEGKRDEGGRGGGEAGELLNFERKDCWDVVWACVQINQ